jgi:putative membrane protein insertion efficiency factor
MNSLRTAAWRIGTPARGVLIGLIRLYRMTLSSTLGGQCRFYPSCSHYAEDAIRSRGAVVGSGLAVWRILRCNPFGRGGFEPAPAPSDGVIRPRSERVEAKV